jgi:hypothetical protein
MAFMDAKFIDITTAQTGLPLEKTQSGLIKLRLFQHVLNDINDT